MRGGECWARECSGDTQGEWAARAARCVHGPGGGPWPGIGGFKVSAALRAAEWVIAAGFPGLAGQLDPLVAVWTCPGRPAMVSGGGVGSFKAPASLMAVE